MRRIRLRLNAEREKFDLDGDGVDELIATAAAGSAWLAEDRNGNGTVDRGRELFGPASGRLGAWRDGTFTTLRELGVGALSVSAVATPFALKEGTELLGQVRQPGVYLTEDGEAGVLQQVDLAV